MNGETAASTPGVKQLVRRVIHDMENLQADLVAVVDELKLLINDIDDVTNRIQLSVKTEPVGNKDIDTNGGIVLQKVIEGVRKVEESPDLDLSYLQMTSSFQCPRWGRSISFPVSTFKTTKRLCRKEEYREYNNATSEIEDIAMHNDQNVGKWTTKCFAQMKHPVDPVPEFSDPFPEFSHSLSTIDKITSSDPPPEFSRSLSTIDKVTSSSSGTYKEITCFTRDASSHTPLTKNEYECYTGSYEQIMEKELENAKSINEPDTDTSEYIMNSVTSESSVSGDVDTDVDHDINTWTSYTLPRHDQTSESSDSGASDSYSDIVNHNTRATAIYGNMIFSDNLVLTSLKRRTISS